MKTLKYMTILAAAALLFASCEKGDGLSDSNAGKTRPVAEVTLDNVGSVYFTFTITPSEDTQFYAYVVTNDKEAEAPEAFELLSGEFSGAYEDEDENSYVETLVTKDNATKTVTVYTEPETEYQVYVVAMNANGLCSEVKLTEVTTKATVKVKEGHYTLSYPSLADLGAQAMNPKSGEDFIMTIYKETEHPVYAGYYVLMAQWFNMSESYEMPVLLGYQDELNGCLVFDGTMLVPDQTDNMVVSNSPAFGSAFSYFDEEGKYLLVFWGGGESGEEPITISYDETGTLKTTSYFDYTIHDANTGGAMAYFDACVEGTLTFVQGLE